MAFTVWVSGHYSAWQAQPWHIEGFEVYNDDSVLRSLSSSSATEREWERDSENEKV